MPSTPTSDNLTSVLAHLADQLEFLETCLSCIEASAGPTITSIGISFANSQEASKVSPFWAAPPTKGKGQANTPQAPSKATLAKKACPTNKGAIPSATIPSPFLRHSLSRARLITTLSRWLFLTLLPSTSSVRVARSLNRSTISLVPVSMPILWQIAPSTSATSLFKWIARKKVHPPKLKKTTPLMGSTKFACPNPINFSSSQCLPPFSTTQRSGPSTGSHIIEIPTNEFQAESFETQTPQGTAFAPTVVMASPQPSSTPISRTISMGSPNPTTPQGQASAFQPQSIDPSEYEQRPSGCGCGNTGQRSRPGPPGSRGRW
ncbi:hypothetical protein BYT27DRAFT_7254808 [Phlegmacium glaucopus]|nr:hypothetical protein BYT27DRAFT_7254808 [Phlegmacium glaucopus]